MLLARRLFKIFLPIVLLLVAIWVLYRFVAVPYAESRAADAIGNDLGAKVKVHAEAPLRPGLFSGDVGDLVVTTDRLERHGVEVNDVHARIHDASTDLGKLLGGTVRVHFSKIDMRGRVGEASLARYLRQQLGGSAVQGSNRLTVHVKPGVVLLDLPNGQLPLHLSISGPTTIDVRVAVAGPLGKAVGNALSTGIDFAPLPYGIRLRTLRLVQGAAIVTAGRGAGTETLQS